MRYCFIFRGEITAGANIDEVKKNLAGLLKADSPKINSLFSGKPVIVKKNADLETCQEIKAAFEKAGAIGAIEPQTSTESQDTQKDRSTGAIPQPPPLPNQEKSEAFENNKAKPFRRGDQKFCVSCGELIKLNSLACPYCGKKQKDEGIGCLPKAAIAFGVSIFAMAIIGILAAIAIPNFMAYRMKATEAMVRSELQNLIVAQQNFFVTNQFYANNLEELDFEPSQAQIRIRIVHTDDSCFVAKATHTKLEHELWANCNGVSDKKTRKPPSS